MESTNDKKRVVCLYRVSTKGQVDKDDIPMQRKECRDFIAKQNNWILKNEYYEKGVSGFKLSIDKRDTLLKIKNAAQKKEFDVLLVYMFDRLGRKDDETPFIVKGLSDLGIEVWSVKEGQQKFETHVDNLLNYIRFWQSSGESIKTSIRVDSAHEQMVKEGIFRGGTAPYGYKLIKSGIKNKKGKELMKLSIDEETKDNVIKIFDLVYSYGYGSGRIASYLNDKNIPSSTGGKWNTGTVSYILKNPIYKGYMTYRKRTTENDSQTNLPKDKWILSEKPINELIIINEDIWNKVQKIRNSRTPQNTEKEYVKKIGSKSPLLLIGMIKCGYCGSPLTTTYNYKYWTLKDGTEKKKIRSKYRCSGKALNKTNCDGQTIYAKDKIEITVLDEVKLYLNRLKQIDFTTELDKYTKDNLDKDKEKLKKLNKKNKEIQKELDLLNKEVIKSLKGKSSFKPELLSNLIQEKENEIIQIKNEIINLETEIKNKTIEVNDMKEFQNYIPKWEEEFDKANDDKKKVMLSYIIDEVIVYKNEIDVKVKLFIKDFINSIKNGQYNKIKGEYTLDECTTNKIITKLLKIAV